MNNIQNRPHPTLLDVQPVLNETRTVTSFIERLHGRGQPSLVRCDDGELYVLKLTNNPQGPNVLANEALGACLLGTLGIRSPYCVQGKLNDQLIERTPQLYVQYLGRREKPQAGVHFLSHYVANESRATSISALVSNKQGLINSMEVMATFVLDVLASHRDMRQYRFQRTTPVEKIYSEDAIFEDQYYRQVAHCIRPFYATAVDNGHLFGGPDWRWIDQGPEDPIAFDYCPKWGSQDLESIIRGFQVFIPIVLPMFMSRLPRSWYHGDLELMKTALIARTTRLHQLVAVEISKRKNVG